MKKLMLNFLAILISTIWISINEFLRNELVLKSFWIQHFENLGINFPSDNINGAIWGVWSLSLSVGILLLIRKFKFLETLFISWLFAFVMMWVVIGNLGVLPFKILYVAVPWSIIETLGSCFLFYKFRLNN